MGIISLNLNSLPFMGICDSTRSQMAAKQMTQAVTHKNCQIPYVISHDYHQLSENSPLGIFKAKMDGEVVFKNSDIITIVYENGDIITKQIEPIKKSGGTFGSSLRYCREEGRFKKDDIIFTYDCFNNFGVPSFGYNIFCGYFNFFGFNNEDGLVVSKSFAENSKHYHIERVFIPIYEYTLLQPIYKNSRFLYFPEIGQKINDSIVCTKIQPKNSNIHNSQDLKNQMVMLLKTMNISDLLNLTQNESVSFIIDNTMTKIHDAQVSGIRIHKLIDGINLVDSSLQQKLEELHNLYFKNYVIPSFKSISDKLGEELAKKITKQHLVYRDVGINKKGLTNCIYLLEMEVSSEDTSMTGDKFCNRYANKGVISLILPDKLRPIAIQSNRPIDFIFNTFGVFSRMNMSQIIEGIVSKNVMVVDEWIKHDKSKTIELLTWLNESIISTLNKKDSSYVIQIRNLIDKLKTNNNFFNEFVDNVINNNLFIEAPVFSEIDIKQLNKNSININEDVLIKKETLTYIHQELKIKPSFELKDTILKNIFCAPIYIMKLHKLITHQFNAREFGPCKYITKQPTKGRAAEGGSKLGQMEIVSLI